MKWIRDVSKIEVFVFSNDSIWISECFSDHFLLSFYNNVFQTYLFWRVEFFFYGRVTFFSDHHVYFFLLSILVFSDSQLFLRFTPFSFWIFEWRKTATKLWNSSPCLSRLASSTHNVSSIAIVLPPVPSYASPSAVYAVVVMVRLAEVEVEVRSHRCTRGRAPLDEHSLC